MSETQTPSQSIVSAAANTQVYSFTDSRNRVIKWKAPTFLEQVRLLRAIGPAQSNNEPYVNIVNVACSVLSIDGQPMPPVSSERSIDFVLEMLGDEGVVAIGAFMNKQKQESRAAATIATVGANPLPESAS